MAIEPVASLLTYFRDAVVSATTRRRVKLRETTADYLASMLTEVAKGRHNELLKGSMVLALERAQSEPHPAEQFVQLQAIGDAALLTAGFFPERLNGGADTGLYVTLGSYAYGRAAQLARGAGASKPQVLVELNANFSGAVDVLSEVAESQSLGAVTRDVVKLFDRWKKTGSPRALEAMARMGAFPLVGGQGGGKAC